MSKFEAELRLPARQQYAYINIKVTADSVDELVSSLNDVTVQADKITTIHADMAEIVTGRKAEIKPVTTQVFDAATAIKEELGGKVVEEIPVEPWKRTKPAMTTAAQSSGSVSAGNSSAPKAAEPKTVKPTTTNLFG